MIPTTRSLALLSVLAYASTCVADVNTYNPIASTGWKFGDSAELQWRLTTPTAKDDKATIYLVGGDPAAYKRLQTLGENIEMGAHKLMIEKVPNVDCGTSCAIEYVIADGPGKGDYYSHTFAISASGAPAPAAAAAAPASASDKSSSAVMAGSASSAATPNGPITLVQNTAKGAQSQSTNAASSTSTHGGAMVFVIATAVMSAASYFI